MTNEIIARFADVPSLVCGEMRARFESLCEQAAGVLAAIEARAAREGSPPHMADDFWFAPDDWRAAYRPYVVKDGTLQIPVRGVLLHDFPYALGSWATGYAYIGKAFDRGMADPEVQRIALICDSPGGEVAGNFDLVDRMFAARGRKPVRAFAMEKAYSAAYSIASVADRIVMSRTAGVGSIGVVTMHLDVSQMLDKVG